MYRLRDAEGLGCSPSKRHMIRQGTSVMPPNELNGAFDNYPLWAAHYQHHRQPDIIRNWTLWQHNESGHVNGIEGTVDFNAFNGDSAAFKLLLVR